jgi:peptidoglycan hydrolase-like protein with peptidoglycan-binding domain
LFDGDLAALNKLCNPMAAPPPIVVPEAHPQALFAGTSFVWPHTPALSGGAVRQWQARMAELGFDVDQDGVYGPQSKAACIAFQRDHGLSADGIVGPRTWAACFAD